MIIKVKRPYVMMMAAHLLPSFITALGLGFGFAIGIGVVLFGSRIVMEWLGIPPFGYVVGGIW
jgi:hypothetical protein